MAKSKKGLQFLVQYEGKPEKALTFQVVVFDQNKGIVFQKPVAEDKFEIPFDSDDVKGKRIFLAAFDKGRQTDLSIDRLIAGGGYELNLPGRISPNQVIKIPAINPDIWKWWWFCKCHVKGHVYNFCGNAYQPVFKARVHICEVDPIIWYIRRLPDLEIFKLRDDIIKSIKNRRIPDPQPDPFKKIKTGHGEINLTGDLNINPSVKPASSDVASVEKIDISDADIVSIELPREKLASFYSGSPYLIKDYLISNIKLLYPFWCWLYPWWLRCDDVAVVETDQTGAFEADINYFCFGDRPDLYFRVEYYINGVWTTVYNPGLRCHTRWNYQCNSEVGIYLNDPRIPCPIPQPNIGDKDVFVFSIGNNVSVTKVHQGGAMAGQTMTGTPYEEGSPFGGSIEPRVYFGKFLADAVDGGNNYFYKWSFRRDGEITWRTVLGDTFRHYVKITPGGPIFPIYKIGPNDDSLYKIIRFHLPVADGGNDLWVVDSRTDTASTKLVSTLLDLDNNSIIDDFTATDGLYEIKMELFKYVAGVPQRVNWTAEGFRLFVPDHTLPSPFGDVEITSESNAAIFGDYEYKEAGNLFGFKMKIFIDNNPSLLSLEDVNIVNADATTGVAGPCGFIAFKDRVTSQVNFAFQAAQENNFATFGFSVIKGNGTTDRFNAGDRTGVASTPLLHNSVTNVATVSLGGGVYRVSLTPDVLLGSCDKAAFLQSVSIHPLVQDGYSRLYSDGSLATAFALEPEA